MKTRLLLCLLALVLVSCDSQQDSGYHGVLYFGRDAYVMRFSLGDGSLSVAGRLGDTTIRDVDTFGSDYLLLTETASLNRGRVSRISWFNRKTGESADLYQGTIALHLAQPAVVVYDDGSKLYAVPQRPNSANQVILDHRQNAVRYLLEAAPGILLIETGDGDEATLRSWNAGTGRLEPLDALAATCRLQGAVWIESLQRLACRPRGQPADAGGYVLADLAGGVDGRLELPAGSQFLALTYVGSQQLLVLREARRGALGGRDRHTVWAYDVRTHALHRLAEDVNIGTAVAYAEF